jgi:hypothetical protein
VVATGTKDVVVFEDELGYAIIFFASEEFLLINTTGNIDEVNVKTDCVPKSCQLCSINNKNKINKQQNKMLIK